MMALLEDVLAALPPEQRDETRSRIRSALERVGRVSGGFWGIGAISRAERRFLTESGFGAASGRGD
jgi:hypothetical protein